MEKSESQVFISFSIFFVYIETLLKLKNDIRGNETQKQYSKSMTLSIQYITGFLPLMQMMQFVLRWMVYMQESGFGLRLAHKFYVRFYRKIMGNYISSIMLYDTETLEKEELYHLSLEYMLYLRYYENLKDYELHRFCLNDLPIELLFNLRQKRDILQKIMIVRYGYDETRIMTPRFFDELLHIHGHSSSDAETTSQTVHNMHDLEDEKLKEIQEKKSIFRWYKNIIHDNKHHPHSPFMHAGIGNLNMTGIVNKWKGSVYPAHSMTVKHIYAIYLADLLGSLWNRFFYGQHILSVFKTLYRNGCNLIVFTDMLDEILYKEYQSVI